MTLALLAGNGNLPLARAVAAALGLAPPTSSVARFPDGEANVGLAVDVRDADTYLVQSTCPPVDSNLLELALMADAARRSGAARVTAVVPYLGYARHDRRDESGRPIAARVMADLCRVAGVDRLVGIDLHSRPVEGFFSIPVEQLTAVPLLATHLRDVPEDSVVVSPDLGASKLAERVGALLGKPTAVVHKTRLSGSDVKVRRLTGDVRDRAPIIVDDMISTAGTIEAAARALLEAGCRPELTIAATHGLFVGPAWERLGALPVRRLVVTDTVPQTHSPPMLEVVGVAGLIAETIRRLHGGV